MITHDIVLVFIRKEFLFLSIVIDVTQACHGSSFIGKVLTLFLSSESHVCIVMYDYNLRQSRW